MTKGEKVNVYQVITDRILALLDKGVVPWRKPWIGGRSGRIPRNIAGRAYRGINFWLLASLGYDSPYFLTLNQANKAGGKVKKGEKGMGVILWQPFKVTEFDEKKGKTVTKTKIWARLYTVFNVEQTEGCKFPKKVAESLLPAEPTSEGLTFDPIAEAEAIVEGFKDRPTIEFNGGGRAYYVPAEDGIHMPDKATFTSMVGYYKTLFHELSHSTGHKDRLNRNIMNVFGTHDYGVEELTAEFSAAFLSGMAGLSEDDLDNNAAYIASWKKTIEADPKLVVTAAARAQKAADYILGDKGVKVENVEEQEVAA